MVCKFGLTQHSNPVSVLKPLFAPDPSLDNIILREKSGFELKVSMQLFLPLVHADSINC